MPPYELKWIDLNGNNSFAALDENHGSIGCANCHGGDPEASTLADAHASDFLADPSADPLSGCGSTDCHPTLAASYSGSMHMNLWGEQHQLAQRAGYGTFANCPADLQDSFNNECTSCHATCGDCHISRPNSVGGGLVDNHIFMQTPDRQDNCEACHGSRVAVDFNGTQDENGWYIIERDIHRHNGFGCLDCHSGEEMHADGTGRIGRYDRTELTPACTECHSQESMDDQLNLYHQWHWPDEVPGDNPEITDPMRLDCFVCHSQEYNNCDACHVAGVWTEDEEYHERNPYTTFKIGYNVDRVENGKGKYVVVRHIPVTRDTYDPWGWDELDNYDAIPNWKYTSPHNIRKWTRQTAGSTDEPDVPPTMNTCNDNCHMTGGGAAVNHDLFLLQTDLDLPEFEEDPAANSDVIVDSRVPYYWDVN